MNAKKEILKMVNKEDILAISLGEKGWDYKNNSKPIFFEDIDKGLQVLDFEFDSGYGGEEGYSLYVWTKDWIIIKSCYDGSEQYEQVPRNPNKKILPESFGG